MTDTPSVSVPVTNISPATLEEIARLIFSVAQDMRAGKRTWHSGGIVVYQVQHEPTLVEISSNLKFTSLPSDFATEPAKLTEKKTARRRRRK